MLSPYFVKRWAILIACLALAGCAVAPPPAPTTPVTLTPAQVKIVHEGVRKALKDPYSAQFGALSAGRLPTGMLVVCGWVNAKNSFAAYVGDGPYYGTLLEQRGAGLVFSLHPAFGSANTGLMLERTCSQDGVPLPQR